MELPRAKHQIVFVSEQSLACVLGALNPDCKPKYVHCMTSTEMAIKAKDIQYVLEKHNIHCKIHSMPGYTQQDIVKLLEIVRQECGNESIAVNLTGGTKLMVLAAEEWAQIWGIPAIYVDTAKDEVVILPPDGHAWTYMKLPSFMDCRLLLESYGYSVASMKEDAVPPKLASVAKEMLEIAVRTPATLKSLNACAARAKSAPSLMVDDCGPASDDWKLLLERCASVGMLEDDGQRHIRFPSEDARKWCNGLWLEDYVRSVLASMASRHKKGMFSWGSSVQIISKKGTKNELDAVFGMRNRLFIIECKTGDMFARGQDQSEKATSILYKADSLHDRVGGIFANSILCTALRLNAFDKRRANELRIRVIEAQELMKLEDQLRTFAGQA